MAPGAGATVPPDSEQVIGQLQAAEAQETARMLNENLRGVAFDDLDEASAAQVMQTIAQINTEGMPEEEVMNTYPELYRMAHEMMMGEQKQESRKQQLLSGLSQGLIPPGMFGGE